MRFILLLMLLFAVPAAAEPRSAGTAHYTVDLTVFPVRGELAVDATIALPAVRGGTQIEFLLGRSYAVAGVDAGPDATVETGPTDRPWGGLQRIAVRFGKSAARPKIRFRYSGAVNPTGKPPLNMITPGLTELNFDSMWVPVRADLGLRFASDLRIAGLADDSVVVAQGKIVRKRGEARIRRHAAETDLAFVAAAGLKRAATPEFELYARDLESGRSRLYRKHGEGAIAYLERQLVPMPGKPVRLVVVRRERTSGYARKGYIVFTEDREGGETGVAKFTAHEFAHLWFSNANPSTEDRWLDESFAEYVALRYVEQALGPVQRESLVAPKRETAASARPILGAPGGQIELYDKGPLLLIELEERIGREPMDRLVREVAKRRIGETAGFLALLTRSSGTATAAWFESRLKR